MTTKLFTFLFSLLMLAPLPVTLRAQEIDGSDLRKEVRERDERVSKLSIEEQLKFRAAERKAAEDPEVKAALEKRNKAIQEFRAAVRASMLRADPTLQPILERVSIEMKRVP